jgi:hypothetical protein
VAVGYDAFLFDKQSTELIHTIFFEADCRSAFYLIANSYVPPHPLPEPPDEGIGEEKSLTTKQKPHILRM